MNKGPILLLVIFMTNSSAALAQASKITKYEKMISN